MRNLLFFLLLLYGLTSCKHGMTDSQVRSLGQHLDMTNKYIKEDNFMIYWAHDRQMQDPAVSSFAQPWDSSYRVLSVRTNRLVSQIDMLKMKIEQLPEDDKDGVTNIFEKEGSGLYDSLVTYYSTVVDVVKLVHINGRPWDSFPGNTMTEIRQTVNTHFNEGAKELPAKDHWLRLHFTNARPVMAVGILNKVQGDLLLAEHDILEYFRTSITSHTFNLFMFEPVTILESSMVKAGDSVRLKAGIASLEDPDTLHIEVGGKSIPVEPRRVTVYHFLAAGKPGKYRLPVRFSYSKHGDKQECEKMIEYTIVP